MPFDGTEHEGRIEVLEKMDRVIGLLSNQRRWCKGVLYTHGGRRCIVGAMMLADAVIELKKPILLAIEQVTGCYYARIEAFNDEPQTTHAVVIRVLRQARENILNAAITPRAVEQRVRPWALREIFRERAQGS